MDDGKVLRYLEDLRRLRGTWVADPAKERQVDRVEAFVGVKLPPAHRAFLLAANGATTSYGYARLFGVGDGSSDIGPWNAHETWKFAWPMPLDDFLSVGQSGWGDQWVYKLSDLRRGIETIHRLDHFMLERADTPVAGTFVTFLHGFLTRACMPEEQIHEARRQLGDLNRDELAVLDPSPFLVGLERATQLKRMGARDAMILNGDLTTQLIDPENENRRVSRFDVYLDDRGRRRVRVHWVPRMIARAPAAVAAGEPSASLGASGPVGAGAVHDDALGDPELPWM